MPPRRIYLDHAASTPVDPAVLRAMLPFFDRNFGNPGSLHSFGQAAQAALDSAREKMAALLGADFREIIFTGSATEANNLALRGAVLGSKVKNPKVLVSAVEHESVLAAARELKNAGAEVVEIPVDREGRVDPATVRAALDRRTVLVSVMYANNELGTLQPIAEIADIIRNFRNSKSQAPKSKQIPNREKLKSVLDFEATYPLFHVDAAQAFQYLDCRPAVLGADLLTLSAHKIYGPKGIGLLYAGKNAVRLAPLVFGGGQEFGLRSGTENVAGAVGFAAAADIAAGIREKEARRVKALRDRLWRGIRKGIPGVRLNSPLRGVLPNIMNVSFPGLPAEEAAMRLDLLGVAVGTGSACASRSQRPSHVLRAIRLSAERMRGSVRLSLGRRTDAKEVDAALVRIRELKRIRSKKSKMTP